MGKRVVEVEGTINVGVRLPISLVQEIDQIVEDLGTTRSSVTRNFILVALRKKQDLSGEDWEKKYIKLQAQNELLKELLEEKGKSYGKE